MYNENNLRQWIRPLLVVSCAFSYTVSLCVAAQGTGGGTPVESTALILSNSPLQAQGSTKPNLMILLDSSGSMAWEVGSTQNPANPSDSRLAIVKKAAKDMLDSIPDQSMRVGYATFDGGDGAKIRNNIDTLDVSHRKDIKDEIDDTGALDSTPLAEAVMDIGRYFTYGYDSDKNLTLHPGGSYGQTATSEKVKDIFLNEPSGVAAPSSVVQNYCQSNFMILLTDGEPTVDRSVSSHLKDYAVACTEENCSDKEVQINIAGNNYDSSKYLPDVAAALYDVDLRPDLSESPAVPTKNNVTSYFVGFADDSLKENQLLTDAARYGGGKYIYTNNSTELTNAFNKAIGSISNAVGTQSSVSFNSTSLDIGSVVYSAQFDTSDNSGRLFAYNLDPQTGHVSTQKWEAAEKLAMRSEPRQIITSLGGIGVPFKRANIGGESQSYDISAVVRSADRNRTPVSLSVGGTEIDSATTSRNGNTVLSGTTTNIAGTISVSCSSCSPFAGVDVVSVTLNGTTINVGETLDGAQNSIDVPSLADQALVQYTEHRADLRVNTSTNATDNLWADRLDYIRGVTTKDGTDDFRRRGQFFTGTAAGKSKILGDIVHSTPIFVGKPELNWPGSFSPSNDSYAQFAIDYADRAPIVYVGANDGMLHGFNAESGEEVFAFVPSLVLNSEKDEGLHAYTSKDYAHNYYVDQTPAVSDVYIDSDWRTVLVGALRGGGKGFFALDVTNNNVTESEPDKLIAAEANAANIFMWEFDGGDATDRANLGYGYSEPQIARLNNGRWAVIFGNGYNSENGVAGLFIVYLDAGSDGWTAGDWKFISTGKGALGSGRKNGLSSPRLIDLNGDRVVDRVYAGDLMGNMWAFDLCDKQGDGSCNNADTGWGVAHSDVSGAAQPLFSVGSGETHNAITAAPLVARNTVVDDGASPNVLVMFGTGQYLNTGDLGAADSLPGAFYSVWDKGVANLSPDNLTQRSLTSSGTMRRVDIDPEQDNSINWESSYGWYMPLAAASGSFAAERVISAPSLRRNTLFFSTVMPNSQPCASSGTGWLMSFDFRSGLPEEELSRPVVDFNNDGAINGDDAGYVGKEFQPLPCTGEDCEVDAPNPGMPGQSGFIGNTRCTPGSAGGLHCEEIDPGAEEREGRLSWEEFSPK